MSALIIDEICVVNCVLVSKLRARCHCDTFVFSVASNVYRIVETSRTIAISVSGPTL